MTTALFDVIRQIKGSGLTQAEVDAVNRALAGEVAKAADGLRTSQRGIDLIHSFESLRLAAYPDPGSRDGTPWTIGWGSTGPDVKRGVIWAKEKADQRFRDDLRKFEIGVNTLLAGTPTTQNQFDALVSLAYNIGLDLDDDTVAEGLGDSSLLRKHLAKDYRGAQAAFASWKYNDGKVMNGLIKRRAAEAALYGEK